LCLYFLDDDDDEDDDDGFLISLFCFILIRLKLVRVLVGVTSLNRTLCFDTSSSSSSNGNDGNDSDNGSDE